MDLSSAINVIESVAGFTDADTAVGEAWAVVTTQLKAAPVPVAERLPGAGDCDENGDCWFDTGTDVGWMLCDKVFGLRHGSRWWLPFHALPLPQGEVE